MTNELEDRNNTVFLEVDRGWLEMIQRAIIPVPGGGFVKVGYIERMEHGPATARLMMVEAEQSEWAEINMVGHDPARN